MKIPLESYKRGIKLRLTRSKKGKRQGRDHEYLRWVLDDIKKFTSRKLAADKHQEKTCGLL